MAGEATKRDWIRAIIPYLLPVLFVAMFIAILIPSLTPRRTPALRTSCAANLKGLGQMLAMYAAQNGDRLPETPASFTGTWMNEQPSSFFYANLDLAEPDNSSIAQKITFCPANIPADRAQRWGGPDATSRPTGYVWLNERTGGTSPMPDLSTVPARSPPLTYRSSWNGNPDPTRTEIALDMIISNSGDSKKTQWTGLTFLSRPGVYATNHMQSNDQPAGANLLYLDGHVQFQKFDKQAIAVKQGAAPDAPYFWFPKP